MPSRLTFVQECLLVGLTALLAITLFFHNQLLHHFTLLFGDRYDAVIEISILEHWRNVFEGLEDWNKTNYFYPHTATLAYNDGYFLYGVLYSFFRLYGYDPFLASELVNIFIKTVGFISFYLAARIVIGGGVYESLAAAFLFTVSNNYLIHAVHAQLFSICFAPVFLLLVHQTVRSLRASYHRGILLWGSATAIMYAMWLMTAYYMAWFTAFFGLIFVIVYACTTGVDRTKIRVLIKQNAWPLTGVAAVFLVSALPFLTLYLPKAVETAKMQTASWTPSFLDYINIGHDNWVWGQAMLLLDTWIRPEFLSQNEYELTCGITPLLFTLFIFLSWQEYKKGNKDAWRAAFIACWLSLLLITHIIGWNGKRWSLWKYAHMVIPGAAGIRAVARYELFLTLPVILLSLRRLSEFRRGRAGFAAVIFCLLVLEQINLVPPTHLDRMAEMARLTNLPPAPSGCAAFYVQRAREGDHPQNKIYSANVDAMLIAEYIRLPTVNGISSYNPPDWDFADTTGPDYPDKVSHYAQKHNISGLCGLDLENDIWHVAS